MSVIYTYDTFLKPYSTGDVNIIIKDKNGVIKYNIDPFSIVNILVSNNLLKINLKNKELIIPFSTLNESKLALPILQENIDYIKSNSTYKIDKQIDNFVNLFIFNSVFTGVTYGISGISGIDGLNGTSDTSKISTLDL